jgi:hypothetical protein
VLLINDLTDAGVLAGFGLAYLVARARLDSSRAGIG